VLVERLAELLAYPIETPTEACRSLEQLAVTSSSRAASSCPNVLRYGQSARGIKGFDPR